MSHGGDHHIKSNGGKLIGGQNHVSSVGVRPHLFRESFHAMIAIGSFVMSLAGGQEKFSPKALFLHVERVFSLTSGRRKWNNFDGTGHQH